jgi:hypothetical protein
LFFFISRDKKISPTSLIVYSPKKGYGEKQTCHVVFESDATVAKLATPCIPAAPLTRRTLAVYASALDTRFDQHVNFIIGNRRQQ